MRFAPLIFLLAFTAHAETVSFNKHVRPILSDRCFACHGPDAASRKADLRLDLEAAAKTVLSVDDPASSHFLQRLTSTDPDEVMPPPET